MQPLRCLITIAALVGSQICPAAPASSTETTGASKSDASPRIVERVEVVATRTPEDPQKVPLSIEVITGEDLRRRGVTDLAGALSLAAGIHVAPGGDGGPASAVPEFRGLREFDAFLLVVDGVPWGGAYNPAISSMSMRDVERIEVLRGPAPVTFGATAFVGAIHVVHSEAATRTGYAGVSGGSYGSGGASVSLPLFEGEEWHSRLGLDADRRGFDDDRTSIRRGHLLWRADRTRVDDRLWFNVDGARVDQDPSSPLPAEDGDFLDGIPIDGNYNPRGSYQNDHRFTAGFGMERPAGAARFGLQTSVSHSNSDAFRGFLETIGPVTSDARGQRVRIDQLDLYVDAHFAFQGGADTRFVLGADLLHGQADAHGADFDYVVRTDASHAPGIGEPSDLPIKIDDRREFLGAYVLSEWSPTPRLQISGGLRLNATFEEREGEEEDPNLPVSGGEDPARRNEFRPSGSLGLIYSLREEGADHVRLFGSYRDTFKPAAIDFGIGEAPGGGGEEEILEPETSHSLEAGVKSTMGAGRFSLEAAVFWMEFRNLVTTTIENGLPALVNAGRERFTGVEGSADFRLPHDVSLRATYSFHDATFRDFEQEFGGVPTQLAGNRIEMSARHLASAGVVYAPLHGLTLLAEAQYLGNRYLKKRNTSLADPFTTVAAGIGYRFDRWEIRVDGRNLTDERPPVSESELGDGQYYPLPARRVDVSVAATF